MNRRDRVKRYLAMLLAFAMIFQQAGITTIADETEAVVAQQSEAAETKVQASAPETSAPETKAPETSAPETKAPETSAPETSAPETKAPETKAPETTAAVTSTPATEPQGISEAAPETQASEKNETTVTETQAPETGAVSEPETKLTETETLVTEAPETQLTETSQTETAATEGETESETETETETESETETEAPKTHFTYEDGRVQITADASEAAKLPQDAVLKADYLEPGSDAYNAAVAKIRAAYGLGEDVEVECAPYDIYFVSQGNRIEPEDGTVKVTIQFVKPVLGEAEGDLIDKGIAHIKDNGSVEDLNGSVNTNAQGAVSSVGFITDSFSVFAPFTVSQVTAQAATSSNLNQFATNVEFDNNLYDVDGALVLHPNSEYSFRMEFAESIDKGLFEKEGELTYTFPNQLTPAGAGGTFDMYITAGTTQYTLSGNTYTIEGNKIKVRFNKDGGAAYEALKAASNAKFWLSLRAKVNADASGDKIKFGDSVEKTVKFDNTAAVSVEKDGSYDKTSGQMNYTIKVKSTGTSTNVKVTDVITGTLLTYDKNVTATSNQKGALTIDPNTTAKGNGFEYTIPSMSDGEEVTFSYSASVDYSKLSGDKFTADETKNTVTAKGDNTDEDRKEHNFNNTTAYDAGFTKSGTKGEITNGWQTSNWTITVNADAKTDVGGGLVTDKIQENKKVPTKYSGTGITVKKYTADGNLVEEKPISWDQLKSHSETTWSYELPPKDGTPYKYVISYTTTSDISKTTENTSIINHAEFGGNETGGNVGVEGQNEFGVTKTHAAPSKDGVNWTVNVTIPNCGFNESFTITDALPSTWNNGVQCRDTYKDGSLKILMQGTEIGSDCYTVAAVTGSSQIQVVFKQEKLAELFPPTTGTERVLTMTYTTIPDSNWPEGENHNNTVTASGDGTNKTANDSYKLSEYKIEKKSDGNAGDAEGGLPTFKFSIYLQGVDKDTITVSDTFKTDLFVIDDGIYSWGMQSHHQVNIGAGSTKDEAGNGANGSSNGGTISYVPTSTGATFTVNVKKSGDAYYNWYCIRYCLKVKDAAALKKLQQMAANNTDHTVKIGNTAEWEGKSTGEVTVDYKVNPLTKTETGSPNKLNHYTSTFTVVVNPDKLQLNRGNDLTVTDTFSDAMELVTDSVKITLEPAGASSWDFGADKKSLTIKIPDGCKAVITYDAQITGKGHVTYKNNVTVTGNYSASTDDKSIDISTDGEGSAEHFQYKVIKRDADNKQKLLQGAIFQLFELKDGSETAVKNNKTGGDVTFTTDAKGEFMMAGAYRADGWELTKGHTYVLKEIQAPEGYKKAEPLTFTVGSITADGAHGNGYTFDIYDKEGKEIDISVVKTWNDANNQDGKRPESVMVQLYANGHTQSDPVELNADNKWSYKWEKLPDKENDELIAYTVRELQKNEDGSMTPVDDGAEITYLVNDENVTYKVGYSNTDNAWTISNTHTPETIDIEGRKTWDDADNQDGKRPSSITIHLYADGRELTDKVQTVTAADNWSWKFTDLPKYAEGKEIVYTIAEDAVENYTTVVDGYNVTNRHIPATINISGGKHWDDNNNQDGKRPSSIKIRLYADDTELTDKVQTVTAADNWEWTFTNLPKYANGTEINYTITEDVVADYTTSVRGYNVTNTYTPEVVRVVIRKVWDDNENQDGKRPTELKVDLKKKVGNSWNAPNELVQTVTLNEENGWEMEIKNLPKYTNGKLNLYNWSEHTAGLEEKGYYFNSIVTEGEITTLTNTHIPEKVEASVKKVWKDNNNQDGKRPTDIIVKLYGKAGEAAAEEILKTTLNEANNWKFTKTDLPKFKNGVAYTYYWTEETQLPDYTVEAAQQNSENSFVTTLTNTHTPEKTPATVTKVWDDADNNDGKRPETITVVLKKKNGQTETIVGSYELNAGNDWTAIETELDVYTNGVANEYIWEESSLPKGYSLESRDVNGTVTTLTNKYAPGKVSASVEKEWNDAGNQDGIRPTSLDVVLKKNGEVCKTVTLNSENHWSYTVADLEDYTDGVKNVYTWEEVSVPEGYTSSSSTEESMTTLTNTHIPETVNATVYKVWDDNNNQDGIRPLELTVTLWRRAKQLETDIPSAGAAVEVKTVTLNQANNWSAEETGLVKYTAGVENEYFWTEGSITGYVLKNGSTMNSDNAYITTLTNTHTPEKTSATVEKRWRDNDNQDRKRPESITVILKKSVNGLVGTVGTYTLTAGADGSWKKTVDDLPKYENGTEIQYFWEESQEGLNGYQPLPSETANNMTLLINAYTPEETSVSVQKVWNDDGNRDGIRPESITVTLYAEADDVAKHKVDEAVLNETNHWATTKSGLAKNVNGKPYTYTWEEENVPDGYTLTTGYDSEDTDKTILTNTHTPETVNATVVKVWDDADNQDGKRPQDLTVTLMKNETVVVQTVTLDAVHNWTAKVENLAKNENGTPIRYSWVEGTMPEGYSLESTAVTDEKNSDDVVIGTITTLTNIYAPGKVSASVKKVWDDANNQDGIRPETLRVNLLKNGQATDQFVILSEENRWSATLDNLDEYTDGTLNEYTWSEELPNGYTVTVSDPDEVGTTTLTNTHTPATIGASVEKTWDDNKDQDGKRPEKLLVTLMRRIREQAVPISLDDADDADTNPAEEVKTVELTAAHNWKASVSNLPKYKDGQMYEYFWIEKEDNIPNGYKLTNEVTYNILSPGEGVTGFITRLTNSHKPQKINAIVKKVWDDNNNQDGKRAPELTVELMRNGTEVAGTVTLNEENNWTGTVENLDKYTGGVKNGYTWVEKNLPEGYSLTDTKKEVTEATEDTLEADITTLTNSYTPGKVEASVLKVWNDGENQDGKRPETITAILVKNGEETDQKVTLSAENDWSASISKLDEYTDGTLNEYTWKEAEVPEGYELTLNETDGTFTTLTNTHTPEVVNATIRKTWNDAENQDGVRPIEIKVDLEKNGQFMRTVSLNTANGWETTVEDLPKYTAGVENIYTWAEQEDGLPEGYELTGDVTVGEVTTLTNTRVPDTVSVGVRKIWNDAENQDGIRPSELRVDLLKNGELTGRYVILNEENGWTAMITDLPKNTAVAEPNVYTWSEELPDGYTVTVSDPDEMGITTLTNTHTPAVIEASVEKTWDDNEDQDGKRPEKLLVTLMRRIREQAVPISLEDADDADTNPAEEVMTVELTAANGWKASVSNQPKYKDGQMYEYFWTEKAGNIPDGYELTNEVTYNILSPGEGVTGFITTLTNTHTPEMTDISVTKVWEDNNNKAGVRPASIQVQLYADETPQGDPVELNEENSWKYTWKDLAKYTAGTEISYRVDEVGETDGYLKSVAPNEDKTEYVITNTITSVTITKVDISDAHELEGAHLQILDSKGIVVAEWDSAKEAHEVTGFKTGELYTLRETVAPDGYTITTDTTFELDEHGKLKEDKTTTKTKDGVLLVEDTATSVKVRKVDITNAEELPGAHIQIWEKTSEGEKLVTEWDSTKEDKVVEKLKTNTTYILRETVAPDGYTITTDTTFELDEHGKLKADKTTTNTKDGVLLVEDARTVEVSKVDLGTGEELDGAHIQVLDKAGNIVDEWDSKKGETHKVKNLTVGQEYTLRETVAPNGYTLTTDTTFTIDRTGKVTGTVTINKDGVLLVEDTATKAEITKLDAATEAPLSGAVLRVIDANGTAVDEWTTDGQPHVIEAKLNTGATYQLIEVKAPDGYEIADPISFTMKADGTTDPVVMKDAMTRSEKASVSVTKKLTFSGEEISAVDATFYVALYADEACTKRISEIMPLVFKKASSATVTFTNVEIGRTYYVGECDANGVNFVSSVIAGNVAYAAIFANGNKATVTEADGSTTVYFENQFATIPDGFYKEGILTITKKLLGSDKKAKNSNEVFYAGIFSDAAYTQLSGDVSENIVALDLAGGSEAEAEVFVAIAPGGSQTLYVTEVDANGKPVAGAAGFKYTVQVDKTSVTLSEANTEAHVTITNTETETETESETKKTTSVKTGDDTPIAPYMALMLASMAMLAAEFICRRKRRSEK